MAEQENYMSKIIKETTSDEIDLQIVPILQINLNGQIACCQMYLQQLRQERTMQKTLSI